MLKRIKIFINDVLNKPDKTLLYSISIVFLGIIAWIRVLDFWFFNAWAPSWLMARYSPVPWEHFLGLMRAHAFIYYFCLKIFGWNPFGWYCVALLLHLIASVFVYKCIAFISKNEKIGFIAGLLFVANVAYHDVLTWGTFNAYYSLIMIFFMSCILCFGYYRQKNKLGYYFISIVVFVAGLIFRETALLIPVALIIFDIIFNLNLKPSELFRTRGKWKAYLVFFILGVIYFIFRAKFIVGLSGDTMDSQVMLRMKLMAEHNYLEFLYRWALAFGRAFSPHMIPYLALNKFVRPSLYPILGWCILSIMAGVTFLVRKNRDWFNLLLFSLIWMFLHTAFTALAMPLTDDLINREYIWNTRRYSYYSFFGVVLFASSILWYGYSYVCQKYKRHEIKFKKALQFVVAVIIISNLVMIFKVETFLAKKVYNPVKKFYSDLKTYHPVFPKGLTIYQYPQAQGLSDLLYEWHWIKELFYPNLKGEPFLFETQMERILQNIQQGKINLDEVVFFDYVKPDGLRDLTIEARDWIRNTQEVVLPFDKKISQYYSLGNNRGSINFVPNLNIDLSDKKIAPAEIPYRILIRMKVTLIDKVEFPFFVTESPVALDALDYIQEDVNGKRKSEIKYKPLYISKRQNQRGSQLGIPDGKTQSFYNKELMVSSVLKVEDLKRERVWLTCDFKQGQKTEIIQGEPHYFCTYKYGLESTYAGTTLVYNIKGNGTKKYIVSGNLYNAEVGGFQYARAEDGTPAESIIRRENGDFEILFPKSFNKSQSLEFGILMNTNVLYYTQGEGVNDIAVGINIKIKGDGKTKQFSIPLSGQLRALRSYWENNELRYQPKAFVNGVMTQIIEWSGVGSNNFKINFKNPPGKNSEILIPVFINYTLTAEDEIFINLEGEAVKNNILSDKISNPECFKGLINYAKDRKYFLDTASVQVSGTIIQRPGEPFLHFLPENIINGNFSDRSQWIAQLLSSWVIIDLGSARSIGAVIWKSIPNSGRVPSNYSYFISNDGENWEFIKKVERNIESDKIEVFSLPVTARYLKMEIKTTSRGDAALMQEMEVVGAEATKVFNYYNNREKLVHDSLHLLSYIDSSEEFDYIFSQGILWGWAKLAWRTKASWEESCVIDFSYPVDGQYHDYYLDIKEGDRYGSRGEFLQRFLKELLFDFGEYPANYEIEYIKLVPKYKLGEKNEN